MELTNYQRARKLLSSFRQQPEFIKPYIQSNLLRRSSPLEQQLPWWSFAAIEAADKLFRGRQIFEYGSGGSTLRYAQMGCQITCVEDDASWLAAVSSALSQAGCAKAVVLHYQPFDFDNPIGFERSQYLLTLNSDQDIIIIDGQDKTFNERRTCFHHAESLIRQGGIILVDDFWRYQDLAATNRARSLQIFESTGPCRIGVTSTAMFFY